MVNALSCTAELWMHSGESGLLSSQQLEELRKFIDVISVLNKNMKHVRAIEFDLGNFLAML